MSKIFVAICLVLLSVGVVYADMPNPSSADANARRQAALARRRAHAKKSGGLLERPELVASKVISVVNKQSMVPVEKLNEAIKTSRRLTKLPIALDAKNRVAVEITLVESDSESALLLAPEEFKVVLNVKKLAADGPDPDKLSARVRKEIVRGALLVLGSGYTQMKCYANPISSLAELDRIEVTYIAPDTMMHLSAASKLGIRLISFVSYRTACIEGWAPQPSNPEQREVWDEVHAMPSAPIKIRPESNIKK